MTAQRLYTLVFSGGRPIELFSPKNPSIAHNGGATVGHLVLAASEVLELQRLAKEHGINMTITPMQGQTAEQGAEKLGLTDGRETTYLCVSCPTCTWLDPISGNLCGLKEWPEETVTAFLDTQPSYVSARSSCPLRS